MTRADIKAAVIGAGRIGMLLESDPKRLKPATHVGMWLSHPEVELAAVCDSNPVNLERAKEYKKDIAIFTEAEHLLAKIKPDIVSISTWRDTHFEIMKLAIQHGVKVVVCEKPIAENINDARAMVARTKERDIHLIINHRRRFDPLLYELKEEMGRGSYGEILQVATQYVYGLMTTGTHLIDTLRFLLCDMAGEIKWVSGLSNKLDCFAPDDDPCLDGILGFENGLKATIQSLDMKSYDMFDFRFYGRKALVHFYNVGRNIDIYPVIESPEHEGFSELSNTAAKKLGGKPRDLFRFLADNAVACLKGEAKSLSTGDDSLRALEILLAMRKSACEEGKRIGF